MFRKLLGLLRLVPCYCGHAAAVHEPPDDYIAWYVCTYCTAHVVEGGGDWYSKRFALVAARHPYAVR